MAQDGESGPTVEQGDRHARLKRPVPHIQDGDIRLLRVFLTVCRNGGFSAAQTELNVALSSISECISRLETRYNVTLCDRGRGGFRLTPQGIELHAAAERLFNDLEAFRRRAGEIRKELSGRILLGMVDGVATIGSLTLTRALEVVQREAPGIEIEMKIDSPQALISGVQNGRYDAALLPLFRDAMGVSKLKISPPVIQSLYCGKEHSFFARPDVDITHADLEATPFAARTHMEGSPYSKNIKFCEQAWTNDMECLAILILTGRYIAYLPEPMAQYWVDAGQMRAILAPDLSYTAHLYVITRVRDIPNETQFLWQCLLDAEAAATP